MNTERVGAAGKSIYGDVRKHPSPTWDELSHAEKGIYLWMGRRVIEAADAASGEKVVYVNDTDEAKIVVLRLEGVAEPDQVLVMPGEELVARKVRG